MRKYNLATDLHRKTQRKSLNFKICNLQSAICNSEKAGFTLIELLIVLFIIGMVVGLVGIIINRDIGNLELNTFAKEISASMRYARSHAVAEKKRYFLIIWKKNRAYGLYVDGHDKTQKEDISPIIYKTFPERLSVNFKDGDEENVRIVFFPQGDSTGGRIEIKNEKGSTLFILINKITGRVIVTPRV